MSATIVKGRAEMSKARARRIERLTVEVDRVLETDRRFFARRPGRSHRLRLASRYEVDLNNEVLTPRAHLPTPPGCEHFCAVKQISPGVRTRVFLFGLKGSTTDLNEEVARTIFERTFHRTGSIVDEEGRRI